VNDGRKPGEDEVTAAAELGIVKVECAHQQILRTEPTRKETRKASTNADEIVNEKALNGRAVSHRTELLEVSKGKRKYMMLTFR
jgi:hypothetical protein